MSAKGVHHTIETLQREVEALRSAATNPAQSQGVLLETLGAFRSMLEELHVAEAALRDSEARSTAILQTAVDGIITIDEHGTIASLNPAAERLFGYTADEVVGHNVNMLMPTPYREEHDGYLARYLQTGERKIIGIGREVRARRRDGTAFPIALAVSEMHLDGHRMFTGIVHDLSARVEAEEALRHQAQLLALSYEPIFVWDLEQGIVLWNQGCERLYGFTKAEAIGRVSHELLHTVHPVSFTEFYAALVHDQQWTGELRHTTRDGHEVIVESRHQLLARDGRWLVLESNRDITARKQLEDAVRTAMAHLHIVTDTMAIPVTRCSRDLRYVWVSRPYAAWLGRAPEAIVGHAIRDVVGEQTFAALAPYFAQVLAGEVVRYEERVTFPDLGPRWITAVYTPTWDAQGVPDGWVAVVIDIEERKQTEEVLRTLNTTLEQRVAERTTALQEANDDIRRFAYIVSHDLRAPLVNLKGFSSELRAACDVLQLTLPALLPHLEALQGADVSRALDQDIPEALGFIETSVTRMDHLIQAILHLARLGRRELAYESLDMRALVQETVQTLAHQIAQRQVQVTVAPLPTVIADRTAMEQIMGDLLTNAVAYLAPGRPGEIVVTGERRPEATVFAVRDNGRGIAAEDIPKVFEPFRRVGRQDVPGEGMGLAYVQMLVRRHGGEIRCHSTLGGGTTFTFTIAHQLTEGEVHVG